MEANKNLDLGEIREKIDRLDNRLVELLEERLHIVQEVAQFKKQTGKKIFDEEREKEVIRKNLKRVKNKELEHYIELILKDIMDSSKEYQKFKIGISTKYVNDLELEINFHIQLGESYHGLGDIRNKEIHFAKAEQLLKQKK